LYTELFNILNSISKDSLDRKSLEVSEELSATDYTEFLENTIQNLCDEFIKTHPGFSSSSESIVTTLKASLSTITGNIVEDELKGKIENIIQEIENTYVTIHEATAVIN
jgi:hypothetical protein